MMKKTIPLFILIFAALAIEVCALLNPAAVYCEALGYEYEDILCIFPDSTNASAWNFLKGKVKTEYSYCEIQGYELKSIISGEKCGVVSSTECSVCVVDGELIEVTTLMNLSFRESTCGDNICSIAEENYITCPADCPSGSEDGYCDGIAEGICDPDCSSNEDTDCPIEIEIPEAECIDNDNICHCKCVGKDNDCINISACLEEPEQTMLPEPEIKCIADGLCHPKCIGTDDIDCLCLDINSSECQQQKLTPKIKDDYTIFLILGVVICIIFALIIMLRKYRK